MVPTVELHPEKRRDEPIKKTLLSRATIFERASMIHHAWKVWYDQRQPSVPLRNEIRVWPSSQTKPTIEVIEAMNYLATYPENTTSANE